MVGKKNWFHFSASQVSEIDNRSLSNAIINKQKAESKYYRIVEVNLVLHSRSSHHKHLPWYFESRIKGEILIQVALYHFFWDLTTHYKLFFIRIFFFCSAGKSKYVQCWNLIAGARVHILLQFIGYSTHQIPPLLLPPSHSFLSLFHPGKSIR